MTSIYLPIITLILGTFLGLLSTIIISSVKHRQDVSAKFIDEFFKVGQRSC